MGVHTKRNPGKNKFSIVNGYYLKKKSVKCSLHNCCFTCPFPDCRTPTSDTKAKKKYYEKKKAEKNG